MNFMKLEVLFRETEQIWYTWSAQFHSWGSWVSRLEMNFTKLNENGRFPAFVHWKLEFRVLKCRDKKCFNQKCFFTSNDFKRYDIDFNLACSFMCNSCMREILPHSLHWRTTLRLSNPCSPPSTCFALYPATGVCRSCRCSIWFCT